MRRGTVLGTLAFGALSDLWRGLDALLDSDRNVPTPPAGYDPATDYPGGDGLRYEYNVQMKTPQTMARMPNRFIAGSLASTVLGSVALAQGAAVTYALRKQARLKTGAGKR